MIIAAAMVLAVGRFLGKFDLEALFTFSLFFFVFVFCFCYIDEVFIPSCIVLDRSHRLRSRPMYVF